MKISTETSNLKDNYRSGFLILALVSIFALTATFLVSNLNLSFEIKTAIFLGVTFAYLIFCLAFYGREARKIKIQALETVFTPEIEDRLLALEEASMFFGASLKPAEMFRLVSSRINELIPFAACALFLPDDESEKEFLKAVHFAGENAEKFETIKVAANKGLIGQTFGENKSFRAANLVQEKEFLPAAILQNLKSGLTVALKNQAETFGVLALFGNRENAFDKKAEQLIEAVGDRVAPLFLSSIAFERNLENALTDKLTNLPNERAFYLVLENQIAESQRFREQRPLTILTLDIADFDEINKRFGHARGDQILSFTAKMIKGQLRQMDFLSRAGGDEFLAVLPTASEEITQIIVGRINKAFELNPFELSGKEREFIKLNFGAASFLKDGETAQELLRAASLRKRQSKKHGGGGKGSVLWFPREYVN